MHMREDMSLTLKHTKYFVLLLLAAISLSACDQGNNTSKRSHFGGAVSARIENPQLRTVTEWDEFTGRFQAMQRIEILARVTGYLQDIKFKDGQVVQKGDVLFVIDQRPFKIALTRAQARFELANKEYKRAKGLRSSKAISEEDYDQRLQERRIAKADLDEAKLDMKFTEVKAPFVGRTSRSRVDTGSLISGDNSNATVLTTLVSIDPIEFYYEASETDLHNYMRAREKGLVSDDRREPHPVFIKLKDEDDFVHEGVIDFRDNELDAETGTIQVRAIFQNEKGLLESGMFARLRVSWGGAREVIVVPSHVIGTEQTRKYIYGLDKDNKAIRKYVTLGSMTEDGFRVIRNGLSTEDRIVVGNLHRIQPNTSVKPITGDASETKPPEAKQPETKQSEAKQSETKKDVER